MSTETPVLPPVVDAATWRRELDALRAREKAATRELDAIAARRRRMPMVEMPDYAVTQGPIDEALDHRRRVGNTMEWYSTAGSGFGADVGAPAGGGFSVNVFLRDGERVFRTWHTDGRGTEQLGHTFGLVDVLPFGRREVWQDSPAGWPQSPTYSRWPSSQDIAARYGPPPDPLADDRDAAR